MRNKDEPEILADCTDNTVPETPEAKRPSKPTAVKAPDPVLGDSTSDSDVEMSGSSVISLGPGKTSATSTLTALGTISFSDKEDEVTEVKTGTSHHEGQDQQMKHSSSLKTSGNGDTVCKRRQEEMCDNSTESNKSSKKRRESLTDDSAEEGPEPSWRDQESMVKKLQHSFPHLNKEELRDVLHEHSWVIEDALEALRMFSEHGEDFLLLSFSLNEKRSTL
ncbi:SWI/SNF-related matrix-associated actin-dependent regulator of chromatin subfamily A containing DEAD/H box 1b isoform X1 [Tachysurus ichikawai]